MRDLRLEVWPERPLRPKATALRACQRPLRASRCAGKGFPARPLEQHLQEVLGLARGYRNGLLLHRAPAFSEPDYHRVS